MKLILLALLVAACWLPALAPATGTPPPGGTPTQQSAPPSTPPAAPVAVEQSGHHTEAFWAGVAYGGLAVTALQRTAHPWLYAVAGGLAIAAVGRASDKLNVKETQNAVAGVMVGATGIGLVFGKNFFGWQTAIKF